MQEAFMNAVAHYHFALARSKPPALRELYSAAKFQTVLHHAAHRNVDLAGAVRAGQHDHDNGLSRNQWIAVTVFGHSWQSLQDREIFRRERPGQFASGTLAHYHDVERV